jgi:hypothetical protein
MKEFIPGIDIIAKDVTDLMLKIHDEFHQTQPDPRADYDKGAALIAYKLGLDYFSTSRDALCKECIVSGGAVTRSALENLSDLFYIYDKPDKYPKAYVESMEEFKNIMLRIGAADKSADVLATSRELKQANKWTNASIEDRIRASGSSLVNIYDLFSYFSHPNPGSLIYLVSKDLKTKQLNLMQQANCMIAISLMKLVLKHTDVTSVTNDDLEKVASRLGMAI